jgi:hypothetical protein
VCIGVVALLALGAPVATPGVPPSVASLQMRDVAAAGHDLETPEPDILEQAAADDETPAPAEREPIAPLPRAHPRPAHYGMTALGTTLALLGGTAWYWREKDFNSRDWALRWDRASWKAKLITFDAVRFDDNHFDTNAFWHPLDGAGLYLLARGNGLQPGQSLAVVTAFSVAWEYLIEFREYPSVNDMIFTPLAAISLGEPAIRLAELLRTGSSGPVKRGVAALLDPVGTANDYFRGERRPPGAETDLWGLPTTYRHRLDVFVGLGQTDYGAGRQRTEGDFGADLFIDGTPGFGREGRGWQVTGPGSLSFLAGAAAVDQGRLVGATTVGKVSMVGAQWRSFEDVGPDPHGQTVFAGVATGFEYATRSSPTFSSDQLGIIRLVGPLVEGTVVRGRARLDFVTDASWDFAMVHPFGGGAIAMSGQPVAGVPTVVTNEGYYFGQGLSLGARLRAAFGRWETGVDVGRDDFRPLGVLDRHGVPSVAGTSDQRDRRRLWVGVRPWSRWPVRVMATADQWIREGRMGTGWAQSSELRGATSLGLIF